MGAFGRFMLGTAFVAAVGGGAYTRHGPGMVTEQEVKVVAVIDHASAEDQAQGKHDYSIMTDKGTFQNSNDWFALKFGKSSEKLQSYFIEGRSYKIKSFEPWFTSAIGDPNITSAIPVDVEGDININIENGKKPPVVAETPTTPTQGNVVPAITGDIPTNSNVELVAQIQKPGPAAEGKRMLDQGEGPGYAVLPNEAEFVKAFFGSNLTTEDLRMHFYKGAPVTENGGVAAADVQSATYGQAPLYQVMNLYSYYDAYSSQDYTKEVHKKFCVWMHEWTHVWQGQARDRFTLGTYGGYDYVLSADKKFSDYGPEQQGDIVADYAGRYLHLDAKWLNPVRGNLKQTEADQLLKNIVEAQFPGAKVLRERMENYRNQNKVNHKTMPQIVVSVPAL